MNIACKQNCYYPVDKLKIILNYFLTLHEMKWNSKHIFLSLLFVGQVLIVQLSTYFPSFIESYYSRGIYPYISIFLRILFGWIPYSVGDLLLLAIVAYYGYFFVDLIISRFKNDLPKVVRFLSFTALHCICFY